VIDDAIRRPLTVEILFGALESGGLARVVVEDGEVVVVTGPPKDSGA
jgi:hypothetical protein